MSVDNTPNASSGPIVGFTAKDLIVNTWALAPTASPADINNAYGARVNVSYEHIRRVVNEDIRQGTLSDGELEATLNTRIQRRLIDVLEDSFDDLSVTSTPPARNPVKHYIATNDLTKKEALINTKFFFPEITAEAASDLVGSSETYAYKVFRELRDELELLTVGNKYLDEELQELFRDELPTN